MIRLVLPVVAAAMVLPASPALAQAGATSSTDPAGRLELAIGAVWSGRVPLGARDANETTGSGGTFRLFSSSTELGSVSGLEGHIGLRVMSRLEAEASGSYGKPDMRTRVDSDFETSNAPLTITDKVQQFTIGGAALWYPRVPRLSGRARAFVRAGAGYLRQLENDGALIVTGRTYDVGGGLKLALTSRQAGWLKGIGARLDARAIVQQKGVIFDNRTHVSPALGASVYVRF
ncbi:MAG TPA: hypothetical protein VGQ16_01205 [Vicinamibacterales bacterium]|nr:hypothetical protein [Vicinamibacterales bacterium]